MKHQDITDKSTIIRKAIKIWINITVHALYKMGFNLHKRQANTTLLSIFPGGVAK